MRWWPEPTAGEVVWCHFSDHINPKPKPRPGLIVWTKEDDPFNDVYFSIPPHAPHGQVPKLGALHPSMVRIAAAFAATSKPT